MSKIKESKNQTNNGSGNKTKEAAPDNQKQSKAYKSAMKAFETTHKRLFPELYKEKAKRG